MAMAACRAALYPLAYRATAIPLVPTNSAAVSICHHIHRLTLTITLSLTLNLVLTMNLTQTLIFLRNKYQYAGLGLLYGVTAT